MERAEVKMYSDYKSPFAFLAFDPAFALEERYDEQLGVETRRWVYFHWMRLPAAEVLLLRISMVRSDGSV